MGGNTELDLLNVEPIILFDTWFTRDDHLHGIPWTARVGFFKQGIMFILRGPWEKYVEVVIKKCGSPIQAAMDELFNNALTEE